MRAKRPNSTEVTFYESGDRPAARYVSATSVREECLEHGRLIGLYWSATGQIQRENVTSGLPGMDSLSRPLHVFELEVDGQDLRNRWDWASASERSGERPGTTEAVAELRHQLRPISLKVVTRLDGSLILARWLEITNTGTQPSALSHVSPWSGLLWNTDPAWNSFGVGLARYTLGYLRGERWGQEGDLVWHPLPPECFRIERTQHRSHGSPYFILRNEITGELFFAALAWSGNWFAEFAYRFDTCLFFRMGPLGPAPLRMIAPGETVRSPEVHLGPVHGDMDAAVAAWHQHLRTSVVPPRPQGKEAYTLAGRVVEEPGEWILREVDIATEMGVEAFMVDAGWYGERFASWTEQRGDWFEGGWLPGGMAGVREYVHDKGMMFGLWMEAEAIAEGSKLYRDHQDWLLRTDDGRIAGAPALNLADSDAARYLEESVIRVIRNYGLDFYKLDYNVTILEGGQNQQDGYAEHESWRHYEALYSLFDRVRREFPQVALENCAGGGGRNDLGMLSRFHYACESDWSTFPFSIRAINALTLFLPPETICYYHNHIAHAHQTADLDTHLRVTLFATPIFVGFGAQSSDRTSTYFNKTRRYIDLAKTFCRHIIAGHPRVFHHTPDIGLLQPADWCVLEYASQDRSKSYVGVFKLSGGRSEYVLRPRGIDLSKGYQITLDNLAQTFRCSGSEITSNGLRIELNCALTSELVLISAYE